LKRLYSAEPEARKLVEGAAGHGVFSNVRTKILLVGGGTGKGMTVSRKTGTETFMKMMELQTGIDFAVKNFQLVWVFASESALD